MRKQIGVQRRIYEQNYRDVRDQVFAHRVASSRVETDPLFSRTNVGELRQLLANLLLLHESLLQLYMNGRQPTASTTSGARILEEKIKEQAERVLALCAATSLSTENA
jgi:hypothetical protein